MDNVRTMLDLEAYRSCRLCPRACGVNRGASLEGHRLGFCGESDELRVAYVGPHFGEEPPITGTRGSGTVFFTGCSLRCLYCQNRQISHEGMGNRVTEDELFRRILAMVHEVGVHNLNFVTPDHFFPHVFRLVGRLRRGREQLPVVYNVSGYQAVSSLKAAEDFVDIYLPDFKYADAGLAGALSACRDYMPVALDALAEMVRQKGFLDGGSDRQDIARRGVLVRHLVLPGHVANSLEALNSLYVEFGSMLPLSIMSQYCPVVPQRDGRLNRALLPDEFRRVYAHAGELGFERLFIQFPPGQPEDSESRLPFLPDFSRQRPFEGGRAETSDAVRNPRSPG